MTLNDGAMLVRHIVDQVFSDRRFFLGAAKRGEKGLEFARIEQTAFAATGDAGHETGVQDALGGFTAERLQRQLHYIGEPQGALDFGLAGGTLGQARAILLDRPLIAQSARAQEFLDPLGLGRILDQRIGRHREQFLQHLRAAARMRQECVFLQRARRTHQHPV